MTKRKVDIDAIGPAGAEYNDFNEISESGIVIDEKLVNSLEKQIEEKQKEIKHKQYAITITDSVFTEYESFINNDAEWNSKEALGIKEIAKEIQRIKSEGGVKNGVIYMSALPLEASHYFISKTKGKGIVEADKFITLFKPFETALMDAKKDAEEIKELDNKKRAAMQGISLG